MLGTPSEWEVVGSGLVFAEPSPAGTPYTPSIVITDEGGQTTGPAPLAFPTAFTITDAALQDRTHRNNDVTAAPEGQLNSGLVIGTFNDLNPYAPTADSVSAIPTPPP